MMTSEAKTILPSLINYINSDLFTRENLSSSVILSTNTIDEVTNKPTQWEVVIDYLPLKFYKFIESYPNMYTIEKFDKKYIRNPKMCAYERYETTNMWRPLMILNRCPNISRFDFEFIRYYNIATFSNVLSIIMSRIQQENG